MSQAGELRAISTFSLPQTKFLKISMIISLFAKLSFVLSVLRSLIRGAMNTGDSKHTASSLRNGLHAKKLRFGKSRAK